MAMNEQLFLSILAMDAYNRSYRRLPKKRLSISLARSAPMPE
jgi:hypothetical protein